MCKKYCAVLISIMRGLLTVGQTSIYSNKREIFLKKKAVGFLIFVFFAVNGFSQISTNKLFTLGTNNALRSDTTNFFTVNINSLTNALYLAGYGTGGGNGYGLSVSNYSGPVAGCSSYTNGSVIVFLTTNTDAFVTEAYLAAIALQGSAITNWANATFSTGSGGGLYVTNGLITNANNELTFAQTVNLTNLNILGTVTGFDSLTNLAGQTFPQAISTSNAALLSQIAGSNYLPGTVAIVTNEQVTAWTNNAVTFWSNTMTFYSNVFCRSNMFVFGTNYAAFVIVTNTLTANTLIATGNLNALTLRVTNGIIQSGSFANSFNAGAWSDDGNGDITATEFIGLGTYLTALNASSLTSGTISYTVLPNFTNWVQWGSILLSNITSGAYSNSILNSASNYFALIGSGGNSTTNFQGIRVTNSADIGSLFVETNGFVTNNLTVINGKLTLTADGNGTGILFGSGSTMQESGGGTLTFFAPSGVLQAGNATSWGGNGNELTNLSAAQLFGILTNTITTTNPITGSNAIFNGVISGNGGGLSNLSASSLASGIVTNIPVTNSPYVATTNLQIDSLASANFLYTGSSGQVQSGTFGSGLSFTGGTVTAPGGSGGNGSALTNIFPDGIRDTRNLLEVHIKGGFANTIGTGNTVTNVPIVIFTNNIPGGSVTAINIDREPFYLGQQTNFWPSPLLTFAVDGIVMGPIQYYMFYAGMGDKVSTEKGPIAWMRINGNVGNLAQVTRGGRCNIDIPWKTNIMISYTPVVTQTGNFFSQVWYRTNAQPFSHTFHIAEYQETLATGASIQFLNVTGSNGWVDREIQWTMTTGTTASPGLNYMEAGPTYFVGAPNGQTTNINYGFEDGKGSFYYFVGLAHHYDGPNYGNAGNAWLMNFWNVNKLGYAQADMAYAIYPDGMWWSNSCQAYFTNSGSVTISNDILTVNYTIP